MGLRHLDCPNHRGLTTNEGGPLASRRDSSHLAVFMLHSVGTDLDRLTIDQGRLRDCLAAVVDAGYRVTGLTEALQTAGSTPVVGLTFDDAYADFLAEGMPVLQDLGCRATLYVPVAHVGGRAEWLAGPKTGSELLDWSGLAEVRDAGHEIGSHGYRHVPLDVLPQQSVTEEALRAREAIEDALGVVAESFCYPHGYASSHTARAVAEAGHQNGCVIGYRLHDLSKDPLRVDRLLLGPADGPAEVLTKVTRPRVDAIARAKSLAGPAWRQSRRLLHALGKEVA